MSLGYEIPQGFDYIMMTDQQVNLDQRDERGPRLERTSEGVFYPYAIENIASIHGTTRQSGYYFFYDWQIITLGEECVSERKKVRAELNLSDHTIDFENDEDNIVCFPNPVTNDMIFESNDIIDKIEIFTYSGVLISNHNYRSTRGILNLSNYQSGIYFLTFYQGNQKIFKKVIKF